MSKTIYVERSIHYSMHDYHGKADFEKLTPMFLGYRIKHKLGLRGPFKRFNYVIHFLKKGDDIFIESGTQHNLVAGDAYIVKPHVPTYYLHENTEIEYAWIGFSGPYAKKLDDMSVVHHVKGNYFDAIKKLVDEEETVYAEPVIEILLSAIGEILSSDSNGIVKEVKDYLDKYYYEPLQVETVAKKFSYTRTYLSTVFKKQYGVTIKEYILNKRLTEALTLIINGTSVSDASERVGFSNVYNFSRSFKSKYGVSPNNYLKKV